MPLLQTAVTKRVSCRQVEETRKTTFVVRTSLQGPEPAWVGELLSKALANQSTYHGGSPWCVPYFDEMEVTSPVSSIVSSPEGENL